MFSLSTLLVNSPHKPSHKTIVRDNAAVAVGHILRPVKEVWWKCITLALPDHCNTCPTEHTKPSPPLFNLFSVKGQPPRGQEYRLFYVVKSQDHHCVHACTHTLRKTHIFAILTQNTQKQDGGEIWGKTKAFFLTHPLQIIADSYVSVR